jgi:hypothetical protein
MTAGKKDAARIKRHLETLRNAPWLGPARKWWPNYLFHFTDITNAVSILEGGKLVCRSQRPMTKDIASSEIIDQTEQAWKNYVRLYFRPRTPTQFHNEGFRPLTDLGRLQAHCPMPVFFLFDAETLLTHETTRFSDGNVAVASPIVGKDAAFLEAIPFQKVYHDSWLDEAEKRSIIYHRHAEVLVPSQLDLAALKWIACRTEAELRTLRELLSPRNWNRFAPRIKIRRQLFYRSRTFVEEAELEQQKVTLQFNRSSTTPGPFSVRLDIKNLDSGKSYFWMSGQYTANRTLRVAIPQLTNPTSYEVRLTLDGLIAFADTFELEGRVF